MKTLWSSYGRNRPILALFAAFVVWKSLLALIVLTAPGVGYDTSTSLLSSRTGGDNVVFSEPEPMPSSWFKFIRWDAIYYTHMSEQGHVFEQEWAFGIGLSTGISWIARFLSALGVSVRLSSTLAGVALSHTSHWLSVIQLWVLTKAIAEEMQCPDYYNLPLNAAALHIISPAGVFLSAPYSESPFSFLSMSSFLSFVYALQRFKNNQNVAGSTSMVLAGLRSCVATMLRSNGVLAGIPFLFEAITTALSILSQGLSTVRITRIASLIAGGLLVGIGMAYPQFLAYKEYCYGRSPDDRRPWCNLTLPSIFTWVQSHYWNVGPFRYWTVSNLPLFLLAGPSIWLLTYSAIDALRRPSSLVPGLSPASAGSISSNQKRIIMSLALPQLVLAILALTSYHVQIITRLSSGYPLWYIWLASKLTDEPRTASLAVRWMVLYALIQAGLYACFLPPA
ncbi:hypothetical protein G647_01132 [Cladophialophora carrionii CBS 160.54]|uniref:GPI mannosyltransferase 2 n=1 Tax=Cladophialophora carrionii CBS 160.54 TaxID=1279043 RepID=V9DPT8_9EURO|nr:uncharacterized protein G647_01132 [Cladophialophora carrionii CBS 160.54]ETI28681.1 hypothetical protein G647_01132 [Cladophialophora carrionii CBS 160.54]